MIEEEKNESLDEKEIEKIEEDTEVDEIETSEDVIEEETEEEKEVYYEDAVNKGDFIFLEMTGRTEETGELIDTTNEEIAQEEGSFGEDRQYGPRLVIVGDGSVLRGLDDRLPGTKFNEEEEYVIPPEEAFGERNNDLIQTIPFRVLRSKGVNPTIGAELEIDGRQATVRSIGAGRVQVDYNHPLAGRNIVYTVKVTDHVTEDKKKIEALIGRRFLGIDTDKFGIKKLKTKIRIGIPDEIFFGENIQIAKRGLALDLLRYFEDIKEVEFHESIQRT